MYILEMYLSSDPAFPVGTCTVSASSEEEAIEIAKKAHKKNLKYKVVGTSRIRTQWFDYVN